MINSDESLLLRTKLHRPQHDDDLVPRPNLLKRLDAGLRSPVILLSAPAGFGKTTLLSEWVEQCAVPSAWLSLDEGDNDLAVFLRYMIAAMRTLFPAACVETEALTRLGLMPSVTVLAHQLSNELDALPGDFVLVLDDYNVIQDAAIHELISTCLRRPPRPLHLVLATRQDPSLPLAKLRAAGRLAELRLNDLRFKPAESVAFFTQLSGLDVDEASAATLDRVVEGWPAGLRLTTLSLRSSADLQAAIAAIASSRGNVMDYLFSEIFANLQETRQAWLLKIAILDQFCGPLCATLCEPSEGWEDSPAGQSFIEWLQAANLFLVPLDGRGVWFRFHHLFLQLLRYRQQALYDSDTLSVLHGRAAAWFAGEGLVEDALRHAFAAGAFDQAVAIVGQARRAVVNQEDWPRLRRWLELFPAEFVDQSRELLVVKAWVLHSQFRIAEIDRLLDRIEVKREMIGVNSNVADPDPLAADITFLRAQGCYWRSEGERCLMLSQRVLEIAPSTYTMVRGSALLYLGAAAQMEGNQAAGFARLRYEFSLATGRNAALEARILIGLAAMEWTACDLSATARMAERLLNLGQQHRLLASRAWGDYLLGCVHYWRNELTEASSHFSAIVERPFGAHGMAVVHSYFGLALTAAAQGDVAGARAIVNTVLALAMESGSALLIEQTEAFQARFALLQGKRAAAYAWADQHTETEPALPMLFLEMWGATFVRVRLAQAGAEHLAQARAVLGAMHTFTWRTHNTVRQIDVLALKALLHRASGEPQAALVSLEQALALAAPAEIVRPFVDMGHEMAALLREAAKDGPQAGFATTVLAAYPDGGDPGVARSSVAQTVAQSPLDRLTYRELDVLTLLGQRLSNKEIAASLVLAPSTVKKHISNLCAKLQVSDRREAVARARALGLIDPPI